MVKTFEQFTESNMQTESRRYRDLAREYRLQEDLFREFDQAVQHALQDFVPTSRHDAAQVFEFALDILGREGQPLKDILYGRGPDAKRLRVDLMEIVDEYVDGTL